MRLRVGSNVSKCIHTLHLSNVLVCAEHFLVVARLWLSHWRLAVFGRIVGRNFLLTLTYSSLLRQHLFVVKVTKFYLQLKLS